MFNKIKNKISSFFGGKKQSEQTPTVYEHHESKWKTEDERIAAMVAKLATETPKFPFKYWGLAYWYIRQLSVLNFYNFTCYYGSCDNTVEFVFLFNKGVKLAASLFLDDGDYTTVFSVYHDGELLVANWMDLGELVKIMARVSNKCEL